MYVLYRSRRLWSWLPGVVDAAIDLVVDTRADTTEALCVLYRSRRL